jgi:Cu-Zn family superoxide dismutase
MTGSSTIRVFAVLAAIALAGSGFAYREVQMGAPAAQPSRAVAVMHPTAGNNVRGIVTFTKVGTGISIVADIEGLTPGVHGFHVHEYGDCSAADGASAGGHFNPMGMPHDSPEAMKRHAGDLGNITAGADGKAHLERTDSMISFSGVHNVIGRGLIVHAAPDDFKTQPTGNAGGRVACGVIGIAK